MFAGPVIRPGWEQRCTLMEKLIQYPLCLLVVTLISSVQARPPEAAFQACSGKSQGQQCQVRTPQGRLNGSCRMPPQQSRLACVPAGHRGDRSHQQRNQQQSYQQRSGDRPGGRYHTVVQSDGELDMLPADTAPLTANRISVTVAGDQRILQANGISAHATGAFPNRGNPNAITEQSYRLRIPAEPQLSGRITPLTLGNFGLGVNGVPFDPGAAEWYKGNRNSGWQYEALSGAVALGLDENHAHVQPTGAYHYHGLPSLLLEDLHVHSGQHSPLVGWAADGFPVYALYGYADGQSGRIAELTSSYQLKKGHRPTGNGQPGGHYDGTFVADYEFVAGSGDLDECNGRFTITPEYPQGTYAYFLSNSWPVVPRCFKGTPSKDFQRRR